MNILIVEDNMPDLEILTHHLTTASNNIHIENTSTVKDSIAKLIKKAYDCIFLDMKLSDSNGCNTIKNIQKATQESELNKHTPIIVLTGQNDYALGKKTLDLGAKEFLTKNEIDTKTIQRSINMSNYVQYLPKKTKSNIFKWI